MNINLMRNIDYYAGVPLCFIMTQILRLKKLIKEDTSKEPKKVLLIELSEMGSAILVDPAMQRIKREGGELFFLIFKKNKPSLKLLNSVSEENIFTIDESGFSSLVRDTVRFLFWAREREIDSVIDLELFSRFTALLSGACGASNVIGYYRFHNEGLYRGEMLTKKVAYNPHVHITKNFLSLVHALYAKEDEVPYSKIVVSSEELKLRKAQVSDAQKEAVWNKIQKEYPDAKNKKILLVNANASDLLPQRRWSMSRFGELIKMILSASSDALVLLTGAPSEKVGLERIKMDVNDNRCINFAGCVEFLELPALYTVSALMVTNDSGPAHFASVTDMPTFVLFGPETPELYGSLGSFTPIYANLNCSPCVSAWNHRKTECSDNRCLEAITPFMVFEKIRHLL